MGKPGVKGPLVLFQYTAKPAQAAGAVGAGAAAVASGAADTSEGVDSFQLFSACPAVPIPSSQCATCDDDDEFPQVDADDNASLLCDESMVGSDADLDGNLQLAAEMEQHDLASSPFDQQQDDEAAADADMPDAGDDEQPPAEYDGLFTAGRNGWSDEGATAADLAQHSHALQTVNPQSAPQAPVVAVAAAQVQEVQEDQLLRSRAVLAWYNTGGWTPGTNPPPMTLEFFNAFAQRERDAQGPGGTTPASEASWPNSNAYCSDSGSNKEYTTIDPAASSSADKFAAVHPTLGRCIVSDMLADVFEQECNHAVKQGAKPEDVQRRASEYMREVQDHNLGAPGTPLLLSSIGTIRGSLRFQLGLLQGVSKAGASASDELKSQAAARDMQPVALQAIDRAAAASKPQHDDSAQAGSGSAASASVIAATATGVLVPQTAAPAREGTQHPALITQLPCPQADESNEPLNEVVAAGSTPETDRSANPRAGNTDFVFQRPATSPARQRDLSADAASERDQDGDALRSTASLDLSAQPALRRRATSADNLALQDHEDGDESGSARCTLGGDTAIVGTSMAQHAPASPDFELTPTGDAVEPKRSIVYGMLFFAGAAIILSVLACAGLPAVAVAYASTVGQPSLVAAAIAPAHCLASPTLRELPVTHPMQLLLMLFLFTCYMVALHEAGLMQVLAEIWGFLRSCARHGLPLAMRLKRLAARTWHVMLTCCTGFFLVMMIAYFTSKGAEATSMTTHTLTHADALRIQHTLDFTTSVGLLDQEYRFDLVQMISRRTNITLCNTTLLDRETALSLGASLGIDPVISPACPAQIAPGCPAPDEAGPAARTTSGVKLLDSGSGVHAVNGTQYVVPDTVVTNTMGISTANGIVVPPTKCTARIPMRTRSGKRVWLTLTDCLILTDSEYTLISVGRLANELQISTTFGPATSCMTYPDGTIVPLAAVDNVLVLPSPNASALPGCASPVVHGVEGRQDVSWKCLHRRFNHRSWPVLRHLVDSTYNPPRAWNRTLQSEPKQHCDECLQAKADATPSFGHLPPVDRPGSISYDVWTASVGHIHGGQRKVIGFHDQYSKVDKFYLLQNETIDEVQLAINKYLAWCSSYNVKPWRFHTDNAPQLSGPRMKAWLAAKGIRCTTCSAHEPKQNSAIENRWRVASNDIRAALLCDGEQEFKVPATFWWYIMSAQMQVAWCIPCLHPADHTKWTTPWQLWSGHRPDVRQHRVLGCLAYYKVVGRQLGKFEPRARRAIHLGRAEDQPAYVLMDLENRTLHVTPHVRFVEDVFPGLTRYAQPNEPDGDALFKFSHYASEAEAPCPPQSVTENPISVTDSSTAHSFPDGLQSPSSPPPSSAGDDDDNAPEPAGDGSDATDAATRRDGRPRRTTVEAQRLTYNIRGGQVGTAGEPRAACTALLAAITMLGVPQTGGYLMYLCSNAPRTGGLAQHVADLNGPSVVNIDVRVGGYAHDLSHATVAQAVIAAASDPRCAGVMASVPCKTWSASRGLAAGGGLAFSQPMRDTDNPLGFLRDDGTLPVKVSIANKVCDCAAAACEAAFRNPNPTAGYIFEAPVARGKDSPFAIPGRENHVGVLDHPSVNTLRLNTGGSVINFDQCCTRDNPTETPQKTTALLASPNLAAGVQKRFGPLVCTHPIGTHPSMVGVDESGELRSTKWERYSPHMNKLLAMCFITDATSCQPRASTKPMLFSAISNNTTPMGAWESFYATGAERVDPAPANVSVNKLSLLLKASKYMGTDFSWNFFDSCIDGQCFVAARERDSDNPSYKQAMNGDDAACWGKACHEEMENLRRHEAAEPVLEDTLPTWSKIKGHASEVANLLWVLKKKYVSGAFEKFKARLVYDGRMQKVNMLNSTGVLLDTFSPTTRHVTHKLLIANSAEAGGPSVTLSATSYIERIAKKYLPKDPASYSHVPTPCSANLAKLYEDAVARRGSVDPALQTSFAKKCGAAIYCLPSCRVDCAYTIGMCARCLTYPTPEIDLEMDRCLIYLFQTRDRGLTFSASGGELVAETDSDWTECHSTNGYCIRLGGAVVAYASKRQHSVALSSTEAEIMGASLAAAEIVNIRGLLREMGRDMSKPTVLYVDNQGAVALSKDMKSCQRSRHIERRYLRIREWVAMGEIEVRYISTEDNCADALTKPLDVKTFNKHIGKLMNLNVSRTNGTIDISHSTFDIEAAYLKGEFNDDEVVYARPPMGYRHTIRGVPVVWRLKIPLYGEADAGRIWNRTLVKQLRDVQLFKQSEFDPCYFRKLLPGDKRIDILMYVDDGYVITNDTKLAMKELTQLHNKFKLTRKPAQYFLGNDLHVAL